MAVSEAIHAEAAERGREVSVKLGRVIPVESNEVALLGSDEGVADGHEDGRKFLLLHVLQYHHLAALGLYDPGG